MSTVLAGLPNTKVFKMRDNIIFCMAQGTHNYQAFMQHPWMDTYVFPHLGYYKWCFSEHGGANILGVNISDFSSFGQIPRSGIAS